MDREQLKEWVATTVVAAVLAGMFWGLWHYRVEMPRQAKAERAAHEVQWIALKSKVAGGFDNYLRAAPLLKGDTAMALSAVVDAKMRAIGLSPGDSRFVDMSASQRWREAQRITAQEAATERLMAGEIVRCSALFDAGRCRDMIEAWHCSAGNHCTESAAENFEHVATHRLGYLREDDLGGACRDYMEDRNY